jgi:hypothetical protein
MRLLKLTIVLIVIFAGCSSDDPDKGCVPVKKALKKISALSDIVEKGVVAGRPKCQVYTGAQIVACIYEGARVYYFANYASSNATCVALAYDCHGDELINWGDSQAEWSAFEKDRTEEELLWEKE